MKLRDIIIALVACLLPALAQAGYGQQQFDKIFINGVFVYINDEEIPGCIRAADCLR